MDSLEIQVGERGVVTLPKALREAYDLRPGRRLTVIDLDGALVLSPRRSEAEELANSIADALREHGETLESMIESLREERDA